MSGETDLNVLLASLSADLRKEVYVFVTLPTRLVPDGLAPRMVFEEAEGTTLIVQKDHAEKLGLAFEFPSRMITLNIHSSLEAVGFMARIATALAAHGMGVNPVAGFFHDHLFVPEDRADEAMEILADLAAQASSFSIP